MTVRPDINFAIVEISDPAFETEGLRHVTVSSAALRRRGDVTLFVPPQAQGLNDIPVYILMHGVYGSHWAWAMKAGAHRIAAQMIAEGKLPPCVLAMPSDGLWGQGSGYVPHVDHDPERWIMDEVPAIAALACPSVGGYGAMHLAGKYPQRFRAVAAHSSITQTGQLDEFTHDDRSGCSQAAIDTDAFTALRTAGVALPPLQMNCGTEDPLLGHNRTLHDRLTKAGIAHQYNEYPGGHEWPYWAARLPATLAFFAGCLRAL
jgi:putative tributyrin esterase